MKKIFFVSVCGATLLAVTSSANAQGTGIIANSDQGVTPKQCWDVSANIIRDKSTPGAASPVEKKPQTTVGSTTSGTGSAASGSAGPASNASARPAGMPDC